MMPEVQETLQDELHDMLFAVQDLLNTINELVFYIDRADVVEVKDDDA